MTQGWNVKPEPKAILIILGSIRIEPDWNVKVAGALGYSIEDTIRIEPDWNVKIELIDFAKKMHILE